MQEIDARGSQFRIAIPEPRTLEELIVSEWASGLFGDKVPWVKTWNKEKHERSVLAMAFLKAWRMGKLEDM